MRRSAALAAVVLAGAASMVGGGAPRAQEAEVGVLPDLVADPANNVTLETYASDGRQRLLLRFDGFIHNVAVPPDGAVGPPTAGALDIRGVRPSDRVPMQVHQLVYAADGSIARTITGTGAKLEFATADGHDHWHLQHAARYSLWTLDHAAEVAPSQKVGFCLDDSEVVEGGSAPFYNEEHGRENCERHHPEATSLFEGIEPGWRDVYDADLTFQWVDSSDVAPGRYVLRTDVDPDNVIVESDEDNPPAWTLGPSTIPGFVAQPVARRSLAAGRSARVRLAATRFGATGRLRFRVLTPPAHGRLSVAAGRAFSGRSVRYTPAPGYRGADRFTYVAVDDSSPFPRTPPAATVALGVGTPAPRIAVGGLPAALRGGASVQLVAVLAGAPSPVRWSASRGRVSATGLFTPPSKPGRVRVTASTASGARDVRAVDVRAPDAALGPAPSPSPPPATDASGAALRSMAIEEVAGRIVLSARARRSGVVRLAAVVGSRELGACRGRARAGEAFGCRLAASATARSARLAGYRADGLPGEAAGMSFAASGVLRAGGRVVARVRASGRSGLRSVCALPR